MDKMEFTFDKFDGKIVCCQPWSFISNILLKTRGSITLGSYTIKLIKLGLLKWVQALFNENIAMLLQSALKK